MKNRITQVSILAAAMIVGPLLAYAWTSAPANPPASNVAEPLNVGSNAQAKVAGLLLATSNSVTNGLLVQNGNVGIGTLSPGYKLQVGIAGDGSSIGTNAFFYMSDASLKNNISTLTNSLEKIRNLRGVSFMWKGSNEKSVGLIAQEVEKVYPELVSKDSNGLKSVQYGNLVAPLIEAVKAQQAEIEVLKARISALEAK